MLTFTTVRPHLGDCFLRLTTESNLKRKRVQKRMKITQQSEKNMVLIKASVSLPQVKSLILNFKHFLTAIGISN